mmetsp:Transcript_146278/g.469189  ORF Transcript_146278/g.469189 Transcript_146278/m.469189 type:complete len:238 (+) Transcript_146278:538-1251(+)
MGRLGAQANARPRCWRWKREHGCAALLPTGRHQDEAHDTDKAGALQRHCRCLVQNLPRGGRTGLVPRLFHDLGGRSAKHGHELRLIRRLPQILRPFRFWVATLSARAAGRGLLGGRVFGRALPRRPAEAADADGRLWRPASGVCQCVSGLHQCVRDRQQAVPFAPGHDFWYAARSPRVLPGPRARAHQGCPPQRHHVLRPLRTSEPAVALRVRLQFRSGALVWQSEKGARMSMSFRG